MTSDVIDFTARLFARKLRRAIPIRETSALASDPASAFGIAPIRMVSEELVQAIAFGPVDEPPKFAVRWNPLSRDPGTLGDFAIALDGYITSMLAAGVLPRFWMGHPAALQVIDLLGHRMRRNKNATPELQRMGALCRAIALEYEFPGQQLVAVASDLLRTHVATGQTPTEDSHLGALTAWINPAPGVDPLEEAKRISLSPANAVLERSIDEEVERLRKIGKGNSRHANAARARIEALLREEALRVTCPPKTGPRIMRVLAGREAPRRTSCGGAGSRRSRLSAC